MHYAFDEWMKRSYPTILFERYADDIVIHCKSRKQAQMILNAIRKRLLECSLELHPQKTKIVYCLNGTNKVRCTPICFDFLGFNFQPRGAINRSGQHFVGFLPGMSRKAKKEGSRNHEVLVSDYVKTTMVYQRSRKVNQSLYSWVGELLR